VARDRSPARQMSEAVESSGPPGGRDAGPGSGADAHRHAADAAAAPASA